MTHRAQENIRDKLENSCTHLPARAQIQPYIDFATNLMGANPALRLVYERKK